MDIGALINQLITVSDPSDSLHREEHIQNLTPIINVSKGESVSGEPEHSFYVGKLTPDGSQGTTIDDLVTLIVDKKLYKYYSILFNILLI